MKMLWILLAVALTVTGCGRALTTAEADFAARLFGDSLDIQRARIASNGLVGLREHRFRARPQTTCRERIVPPPDTEWLTGRTAGVTLWNQINIRSDIARPDFVTDADGITHLGVAMFFAHEMTHVWQWQNREITGYTPIRGGLEHQPGVDPYLFDAHSNPNFTDYGYEQQASLVEEYVCCMAVDPRGARTARLHELLSQVMTPGDLPQLNIQLPWPELDTRGICS